MSQSNSILDFAAVDGVAFAAERGRLDKVPTGLTLRAERLGPLLELTQLAIQGRLPEIPSLLDAGKFGPLRQAILDRRADWTNAEGSTAMMTLQQSAVSNAWTSFAMGAKRAAVQAGFDSNFAGQMVAALRELEDNIREHAGTLAGASLSYHAEPGCFEFTIADQGCGVLATLRSCADLAHLPDDGAALRAALQDGVSRFGTDAGRGHGYRPLFTGLVNRRAALRFRSGSGGLAMDGITPGLPAAQIGQKPQLTGFFASVCCTV